MMNILFVFNKLLIFNMIHAQFIKIYHYFTTYSSHIYQIFYHEIIEKKLVTDV